MFYLKVHDVPGEVLVAACDRDVLGKCFTEGRLQLDVNEKFYKGSLVGEGEVLDALERASIANLVGNRVVAKAIEKSLVSRENVIEVGGIKHAQVVSLPKKE